MNVEYKIQGQVLLVVLVLYILYILYFQEYVSLKTSEENGKDIISELVEDGLLRFEKNRRCSSKLVSNFHIVLVYPLNHSLYSYVNK